MILNSSLTFQNSLPGGDSSTYLPAVCSDSSLFQLSPNNVGQSEFSLINQNIFVHKSR